MNNLTEKDFELFKTQLEEVVENYNKKGNEQLSDMYLCFSAELEESDNEDSHFYEKMCWNYHFEGHGIDINSDSQSDGYFYDEHFIKDGLIDYSYIDSIRNSFASIFHQVIKIEEKMNLIQSLEQPSIDFVLKLDIEHFEFFEHDSIPNLLVELIFEDGREETISLSDIEPSQILNLNK